MDHKIYHLHAISGLHVGTGQGIGVIDMPIARERASNLPQVPGSGIKGVLRDECKDGKDQNGNPVEKDDYLALFGPEAGEKASKFAGALAVGDARLLCLPIRSWKGTFAWVTCPMILRRYQRDIEPTPTFTTDFNFGDDDNKAFHFGNGDEDGTKLKEGNKIYLEDLDLVAQEGAKDWATHIATQIFTEEAAWQTLFKERFLIVHDNVFDFLSETATEIRARIKIEDNTRTVKSGALWYEEYLPAETILWGIIASDKSRNPDCEKNGEDLLKILPKNNTRIQMGGNATVGAGQVRWIFTAEEEKEEEGGN